MGEALEYFTGALGERRDPSSSQNIYKDELKIKCPYQTAGSEKTVGNHVIANDGPFCTSVMISATQQNTI
jgi:hypothetical protein